MRKNMKNVWIDYERNELVNALKDVINGKLVGKWMRVDGNISIEIINDGNMIPKLVVGVYPNIKFDDLTEHEQHMVKNAGIDVVDSFLPKDDSKHCYMSPREMKYITICNFRRSGWAWAPGRNPKQGYKFDESCLLPHLDEVSALKVDFGRMIGELSRIAPFEFAQAFRSIDFSAHAAELLDEAIGHVEAKAA